ncbi:MAG: peptidylprolyl isomerase [Deltaproteobacteria bacterium]|nr:peptidylprolyl isomerase [Deltaproteobacteria bacterium]
MSANFEIDFKDSNGNLHIDLKGDFDGSSAWELINLIHEKYNGLGRVYIDTEKLGCVHPFGVSVFRRRLNPIWLPLNRLFVKGKKGFDIAPKGSKVVVIPAKRGPRRKSDFDPCQRAVSQKEMTS